MSDNEEKEPMNAFSSDMSLVYYLRPEMLAISEGSTSLKKNFDTYGSYMRKEHFMCPYELKNTTCPNGKRCREVHLKPQAYATVKTNRIHHNQPDKDVISHHEPGLNVEVFDHKSRSSSFVDSGDILHTAGSLMYFEKINKNEDLPRMQQCTHFHRRMCFRGDDCGFLHITRYRHRKQSQEAKSNSKGAAESKADKVTRRASVASNSDTRSSLELEPLVSMSLAEGSILRSRNGSDASFLRPRGDSISCASNSVLSASQLSVNHNSDLFSSGSGPATPLMKHSQSQSPPPPPLPSTTQQQPQQLTFGNTTSPQTSFAPSQSLQPATTTMSLTSLPPAAAPTSTAPYQILYILPQQTNNVNMNTFPQQQQQAMFQPSFQTPQMIPQSYWGSVAQSSMGGPIPMTVQPQQPLMYYVVPQQGMMQPTAAVSTRYPF